MFEKNPLTLVLIVVIIIMAFMLYCSTNPAYFKNLSNKGKSRFEDATPMPTSMAQPPVVLETKEPALNMDIDPTLAKRKTEGAYQDILM